MPSSRHRKSPDAKRAKRLAQRERYDTPRPKSLLQEPTEQVRLRAFAGMLFQVPPARVSDATLQALGELVPALLEQLGNRPTREDSGRPSIEYVTRYYGLGRPAMTTEAIAEELGVARITVTNSARGGVEWLREGLEQQHPELVQRARADAATTSDDQAFWDRVDRAGPGGCWLWQGAKDLGYGVLKRKGQKWQAHRYAYTLAVGEIPEGLQVAHVCKVRHCVNPEHLRLIEPGEEVLA